MQWNPDLLRACFEYLDATSLIRCEAVSKEWHAISQDPFVWSQLYCAVWRCGASLPHQLETRKFSIHHWKNIHRQRRCVSLELSTRGSNEVTADQTVEVISCLTEQSFFHGWTDSTRTEAVLEPLAISRQASETRHSDVLYFEACFNGCGSVGFVYSPTDGSRSQYGDGRTSHVGWHPFSYGYHSDDGRVFWNHGTTEHDGRFQEYGPQWGKVESPPLTAELDTIGCGVDLTSGELFFTKNGVFLGYAPVRVETTHRYMAAVTLHNRHDAVEINLGRKAFVFDIEAFVATGAAPAP